MESAYIFVVVWLGFFRSDMRMKKRLKRLKWIKRLKKIKKAVLKCILGPESASTMNHHESKNSVMSFRLVFGV